MNGHISEELPRLLTGEVSRETVFEAAAHLRECTDCQQELVSAVVAHASLTSAQRFAPEVVHTERSEAEQAVALPDLSAIFAQVRDEAVHTQRRAFRLPSRAWIGAAAAVLVVGAGVGTFAAVSSSDHARGQAVALAAFHDGTTNAQARIAGDSITVNASSLPKLAGKRYEVWLTNPERTQMQPIGWIGTDGRADLTVPSDLVARYSDIEVSVQPVASTGYEYSNVSVLRGAYSD